MDTGIDTLWANQLVPLSAFCNDNFNNSTVTFRHITRDDKPVLLKHLLSPLFHRGRRLNDFPILFHVTGIIHHEGCSLSSHSISGTTDEVVHMKLCFKELPESVSRVEWSQCATAIWWLTMLVCTEFKRPVETEEAFCKDANIGHLRLVVQGEQINHLCPDESLKQRLEDLNIRCVSSKPSVWFDSLGDKDYTAAGATASGSADHQLNVTMAGGAYSIHNNMDRRVYITSAAQLPANIPVHVTFSLELNTREPLIYMYAKIAKITLMAPL
ncbi:hypothetical protein BC835DRAFT_1311200 [Cytidiella melzeri]|nr:hypothetical protein BC835DRAFT_1311200 [Cytidiella melzeri]